MFENGSNINVKKKIVVKRKVLKSSAVFLNTKDKCTHSVTGPVTDIVLRACLEKSQKNPIFLKMQRLWREFQFGNCFNTSMKTGNLLSGDMGKNPNKERSLENV